MTPEEITRRAYDAERLLNDPLISEGLDRAEKQALDDMLKLNFWESKKQRMLLDRINTIRSLRAHLKSVILNVKDLKKLTVA